MIVFKPHYEATHEQSCMFALVLCLVKVLVIWTRHNFSYLGNSWLKLSQVGCLSFISVQKNPRRCGWASLWTGTKQGIFICSPFIRAGDRRREHELYMGLFFSTFFQYKRPLQSFASLGQDGSSQQHLYFSGESMLR